MPNRHLVLYLSHRIPSFVLVKTSPHLWSPWPWAYPVLVSGAVEMKVNAGLLAQWESNESRRVETVREGRGGHLTQPGGWEKFQEDVKSMF